MSTAGAFLLALGAGADRNHHTLCAVANAMVPFPFVRHTCGIQKHLKAITGDVTWLTVPGAHDPRG